MGRPKNKVSFKKLNCSNCKKEFELEDISKNKNRIYCSKKCSATDKKLIEQRNKTSKETFDNKYGCHPMQTDDTKKKFKESMISTYGVEHALQNQVSMDKFQKTKIERYGDKNYFNLEKYKNTCLERYGVSNAMQIKGIREQNQVPVLDEHFQFLKSFSNNNNLEFLESRETYKGYHFTNIYNFLCKKCNTSFTSSVYHLNSVFCNKCEPHKRETTENELFDFIKTILPNDDVKRRDRTVLNGKELDFLIPSKKVAIELNGLYWHSENGGKLKKHYHLNKLQNCAFHGIRLIHIYESEWNYKRDIIKSILKTTFGVAEHIYNARQCEVKEVDIAIKNKFLNDNHIQGEDRATIKLGLFTSSGDLISLMTFRKTSRFDKNVEWELSRFVNKQNTSVRGGASKLFKHFIRIYKPRTIISYSDRRLFGGNIYQTLGFQFIGNTSEGYHYISKDYKHLFNRMGYQKHMLKDKLDVYDEKASEWTNMQANGYDRIWDCGNSKWLWTTN